MAVPPAFSTIPVIAVDAVESLTFAPGTNTLFITVVLLITTFNLRGKVLIESLGKIDELLSISCLGL